MGELITATGKKYRCDYFNPSQVTLQCHIRISNAPIEELAAVFSDPAETANLSCGGLFAEQYTRLVAIIPEWDAIRIVLGRER